MTIETDILSALSKMNAMMGKVNDNLVKMGRAQGANMDGRTAVPGETDSRSRGTSARREKDIERRLEKIDKAAKDFYSITKDFTSNVGKTGGAWAQMQKAVKETGGMLAGAAEELRDFTTFGNSFFLVKQNAEMLAEGMGRYASSMAKTYKSQSLLYAKQLQYISQFEDYEQAAAYEKLTGALEGLDEGAKKALDIIDLATGKLRTDLNFSDLAEKRAVLGDVLASVAENLSHTDFKSITDFAAQDSKKLFGDSGGIDDSGSNNRAAITKIAAALEGAGLYNPSRPSLSVLDEHGNLKDNKGLNDVFSESNAEEFKNAIAKVVKALEESAKKTDKAVTALVTPMGKLATALETQAGRTALVNKALGYFLTTAALKAGADGLKRLYREVTEFNVAQIPASFWQVQQASVQLGMNFKETTAILADNKRILAIYGPKEFSNALGTMKNTFAKFGYNMAQGAELIGPTVEAAIASGINIRDPGALNSFTDSMMSSFKKISGIVNISAKEFIQLNGQLFKSEGTFETMMGMDVQRRQQYAQELIQLRERFVIGGLEVQQAQKLVELQQQQQRDKVTSRFGDAGKLLALSRAQGMSPQEAMELFKLSVKGIRTPKEQERLTSQLGELSKRMEESRIQGYESGGGEPGMGAGGYMQDILRESLMPGGALGEMMKSATEIRAAKESGSAVQTAEQKRADVLSRGSESVAKFGNAVNSLTTIWESALKAATLGTAVSFTALILQSRGLYASLGMLSAKIATMGIGGKAGAVAGGAGIGGAAAGAGAAGAAALAARNAKILKGAGIATIGGVVGGLGADALKSSGHTKTGGALDVLSQTATMAGTGALLGSAVPVIGTAAGAIAGGVLGAGMGLYSNWDNFVTPTADAIKMPNHDAGSTSENINTKSSSDEILEVKDSTVAQQLVLLSNLTTQIVSILQKISEKDLTEAQKAQLPSIQTPPPAIPSSYSFMTGRPVQQRAS